MRLADFTDFTTGSNLRSGCNGCILSDRIVQAHGTERDLPLGQQ